MSALAQHSESSAELARFVLPGNPITKKNSSRLIRIRSAKTGKQRTIPIPSKRYSQWAESQTLEALKLRQKHILPFTGPVHVQAHFYCQYSEASRRHGDINNYQAGLADWLEKSGVLSDDKQIKCWDGSRVHVDPVNPRIIVIINNFHDSGEQLPATESYNGSV